MNHESDVAIIGAGPVGLFQVFELGLQGLSARVIDALPQPGGQCTELYPDKPIYDIPAVPRCTGQQLIDNLMQQIRPFDPGLHLEQEVVALEKQESGFLLTTSKGESFRCKAVVIAAGGGSFTPVRVRVEGIEQFEDSQLFYRVRNPAQHAGKDIVILGGGDSALDWALALHDQARSVTVINRTERFRGAEASVQKIHALEEQRQLVIHLGTTQAFDTDASGRLSALTVKLRQDESLISVPVEHLLVFFGMSPKAGAIENWSLEMERKLIGVSMETFQTNREGVYAVGDINTYPGKRKLILSGFHEAALAAYAIKQQLEPDKKVVMQYTTTSTRLQERLGVKS